MDQKNRLWRKRSSEKTIVSNGDEMHMQLVPGENDLDTAKETAIQDYEKQAENAMAAKHEVEEEARRLKDELDKVQGDRKKIEDKLSETNKNLSTENSYLTKALLVKEKTNNDLKVAICQKEAELETLMTRLDSTEKENAFLRYESRSLEKELVHLNEEMECQRLENNRKIMKLESECQRPLKRFGIDQVQGRKSLGITGNVSAGKKVRDLERENSALKESLVRKEEEIISYQRKFNSFPHHLSPVSSRSWPVSVSELNDHGSIGACSEMRLMDDFVEMEKLAIVATDLSFPSETKSNEDWISDMKNIILRQHNITKTSVEEILGDIKIALEGNVELMAPISGYHHLKVRDEFRKHLGGEGLGTAFGLESVQTLMVEMEKMESGFHLEIEKMRNELDLIRSSEEVEMLRESKKMAEDQIENLEMVIVDLDTQLTFTKSELTDLLQKASNSEGDGSQKELLLISGTKTARSSETIMKMEKHINEQPLVDKVMAKSFKLQRSSLRDQMMYEDNNSPVSPKKKEVISTTTNENVPSVFSFPDGQEVVATPKRANDRAVVITPSREKGGWGFMKKLLVRRKKHGNKNIYCG